jgi:hypothetical protein
MWNSYEAPVSDVDEMEKNALYSRIGPIHSNSVYCCCNAVQGVSFGIDYMSISYLLHHSKCGSAMHIHINMMDSSVVIINGSELRCQQAC